MYTVEVKCNSLECLIMELIHRVVAAGRGVGVRPPQAVESKGRQIVGKMNKINSLLDRPMGGGGGGSDKADCPAFPYYVHI